MASFRCFPEIWLALLWLTVSNAFTGWKILQKIKRIKYYQQTNFTIFITMYWKGKKRVVVGERRGGTGTKNKQKIRHGQPRRIRNCLFSVVFWKAFCIRSVFFPPTTGTEASSRPFDTELMVAVVVWGGGGVQSRETRLSAICLFQLFYCLWLDPLS